MTYSILKFSAPWCGPCKALQPAWDFIKSNYPEINFIDINVDEETELTKKYSIRSIPTFVKLDENGELVDTRIGTDTTIFLEAWVANSTHVSRNI